MTKAKEVTVIETTSEEKKDELANEIVDKWNELITNVQNSTISLCLIIKDMLKDYPDETVKDIVSRVRSHPNIKKFISIDRIWQGLRLVKNRPDLIEYINKTPEEKDSLPFKDKPYLKKDGEVFWEFYFELEKAPIGDLNRKVLELDGKEELWSFRQLREKVLEKRDELLFKDGMHEVRKLEKYELIKKAIAIIKSLPFDKLATALDILVDLEMKK